MEPLSGDRKCFRMINGVLAERTVKDVVPALKTNLEGLEKVLTELTEQYNTKTTEMEKWKVILVFVYSIFITGSVCLTSSAEEKQCPGGAVRVSERTTHAARHTASAMPRQPLGFEGIIPNGSSCVAVCSASKTRSRGCVTYVLGKQSRPVEANCRPRLRLLTLHARDPGTADGGAPKGLLRTRIDRWPCHSPQGFDGRWCGLSCTKCRCRERQAARAPFYPNGSPIRL